MPAHIYTVQSASASVPSSPPQPQAEGKSNSERAMAKWMRKKLAYTHTHFDEHKKRKTNGNQPESRMPSRPKMKSRKNKFSNSFHEFFCSTNTRALRGTCFSALKRFKPSFCCCFFFSTQNVVVILLALLLFQFLLRMYTVSAVAAITVTVAAAIALVWVVLPCHSSYMYLTCTMCSSTG